MLVYQFFIGSLYRICTDPYLMRRYALYNLTVSYSYLIRHKKTNNIFCCSFCKNGFLFTNYHWFASILLIHLLIFPI
jgi:hypothetical protein